MTAGESEIVGRIDTGTEGARLEVAITDRDGKPSISLHLSTFSDALGWQVQKTIPIAPDNIARLQRLLCETRNRLDDATTGTTSSRIIPFARKSTGSLELEAHKSGTGDALERAG
jgi:hypothetical protein